jgi:hypothetical protein
MDAISSLFVVEVWCSRFSRRRAQNPGVFGCWIGWSGAIAGLDEMVGFWGDMVSARFLVEDPSWRGLWGVEPLGLRVCRILDMERNRKEE